MPTKRIPLLAVVIAASATGQPWGPITNQNVKSSAELEATMAFDASALRYAGVNGSATLQASACPAGESLPAGSVALPNSCGTATYTYNAAAGVTIALRAIGRGQTYGPRDYHTSSYATLRITGPAPATTVVAEATYRGLSDPVTYLPETGAVTLAAAGTYNISVVLTGGPGGQTTFTAVTTDSQCVSDVVFYSTYGAFALAPAPFGGGTYRASVGVAPSCPGTVTPGASWVKPSVTVVPGGFSEFNVAVLTNDGPERSTTLTVGYTATTIRQANTPCSYAISSSSILAPAAGANGTVDLATAPGCLWQTSSSASWVQPYPLTGSGSAPIKYTVFPNFSTEPRAASLSLATPVFSVSQMANAGSHMQRFVQLLYFSYLGRMPAQSEINVHLASGFSREQLALNFFNSQEFNQGGRFVAGLYVGLLDRDAEHGGWLFQRNALATGLVDQETLVQNFLKSQEFESRFGNLSNSDFVRMLYRNVLLREPQQAEVDFQVAALVSYGAQGRMIIARNFLNAPEFHIGTGPRIAAFLAYATLLQRQPTSAEFTAAAAIATQAQALKDLDARYAMIRDGLLAPIIRTDEMRVIVP